MRQYRLCPAAIAASSQPACATLIAEATLVELGCTLPVRIQWLLLTLTSSTPHSASSGVLVAPRVGPEVGAPLLQPLRWCAPASSTALITSGRSASGFDASPGSVRAVSTSSAAAPEISGVEKLVAPAGATISGFWRPVPS